MRFLIFFIFSIPLTFAEDSTVSSYCFNHKIDLTAALNDFSFLKLPSEKSRLQNHCFEIISSVKRADFYNRYFKRKYAQKVKIDHLAHTNSNQESCRIQIEKRGQSNNQVRDITLGNKARVQDHSVLGQVISRQEILVSQGKKGSFDYLGKKVEVTCKIIGQLAHIQLETKRSSHLVTRGQDELDLSTSLSLNRGQKIEVGSVLKKIDSKGRQINIPAKIGGKSRSGYLNQKVYLSWK